jgi:hypothetical protein
MIDISQDIDSLSHFKRDTVKFIRRLKESGRPVVLTVNGKAEIVVQDAKSFQHLLDLIEQAEAVMAIREGLESMGQGAGVPAEEAFEAIRSKYQIPGDA